MLRPSAAFGRWCRKGSTESYSKPTGTRLPPIETGTTLFCDFDGPIVDVSGRYHSTYLLALARTRRRYAQTGVGLRLTPMGKAEFWRMKQARIPDGEIALRSGLRGEQIQVFLEQVKELVNCCPALLRRDLPQPEVAQALLQLQQEGLRIVLVTLRHESQVHQFLHTHGLQDCFDGIYGTQDIQAAYQNYTDLKTVLLERALADQQQQLGSGKGKSAWMIGDTEADVIAAQRLGIPAIALTCGIRSSTYLEDLQPHAVHPNLTTLTQDISAVMAIARDCN